MKKALAIFCFCAAASYGADSKWGIFEAHADVGETPKKGSAEFDASTGEYRVTGGGANIWTTVDAFQFVSKQMSGDMAFTADVRFMGTGAVQHRKAVLMIRQSLDPGSAYADVALHGDGLTSLQDPRGGCAHEGDPVGPESARANPARTPRPRVYDVRGKSR